MRSAPAALAVVAGIALAALPALPWYAVRSASVDRTATGLSGSGELWILPLLGLLAAAVGLLLAFGAPRDPEVVRGHGILLVAVAILAAVWCTRGLADPAAKLMLVEDGEQAPVAAPVELLPAALAAPVAVAILLLAGLALARPARGTARPRRR